MGKSYLEEIKIILKSLVVSYPGEVTIEKLNRDFKDTEGYWIPFQKLGYHNLESFLHSLTETLVIHGTGATAKVGFVPSDKLRHIDEMISDQKNTRRVKKPKSFSKQSSFAYRNNYKKSDNFGSKFNYTSQERNNCFQHSSTNCRSRELFMSKENSRVSNPQIDITNTLQKRCEYAGRPAGKEFNLNNAFFNLSIGKATKENQFKNEEITKNPPFHINTNTQLNNNSIQPSKKYLQPSKNNALTSIIGMQPRKNNTQPSYQYIQPSSKNTQPGNKLSKNCSHSINPLYSQSNSILENETIDFFSKSTKNPRINHDLDEAIPEFAANSLVFRVDFPENTVLFGAKIKPYEISEELRKGSVIRIFIAEVHNPFKFWFHIHKENHELDILMHRIERFYSKLDSKDYCIPLTCITPGQICAALYNQDWHRAEILALPVNSNTKVYFVDYGTVSEVPTSAIKYLSTEFANINAQALRGSLSHIKPKKLHWEKNATDEFLSMVKKIMVYAQITEVDMESRVVHMVLCDSNKETTVQINKALVERGLASFDEEWEDERIRKSSQRVRHPREDFPTFEMIEKGEYPSYSQLNSLFTVGIDYERIIDSMVFHPGNLLMSGAQIKGLDLLNFPLLNTNPFKCDIIYELCRAHRSAKC